MRCARRCAPMRKPSLSRWMRQIIRRLRYMRGIGSARYARASRCCAICGMPRRRWMEMARGWAALFNLACFDIDLGLAGDAPAAVLLDREIGGELLRFAGLDVLH